MKPLDAVEDTASQADDASVARSGETLRQGDWRDELLKTGIRGKAGQRISFARLEPLPGTRWLHADGEKRPDDAGAERVVISFGPEHAPLEQRQVALAIEEAQNLVPRPKIIVFAAFQFDPEASKDIDQTHWPGVTLLKAQMNADLLTDDLKKKRASNESFWLIGQPDVDGRTDRRKVMTIMGSFACLRPTDSTTTTRRRATSNRVARTTSRCGCSTPTMTAAACFPRQVFFLTDGSATRTI